jgi:two-component system response regulator AtoC
MMEREITRDTREDSYITFSPRMKILKQQMLKIAPTPSTVLITGESGSGKEVSARFIHDNSRGADNPFFSINIGGIPETLLESELFGYEKGAFTGADNKKQGLFELASGGTLFLDEIGEMPMSLQVKLLRVLQEKTIRRLGGVIDIPIDARIIAATNKNLVIEIENKRFREDLYYRLNVIQIELLPLRERKEDILPLSASLLNKLNKKMNTSIQKISPESMSRLESYEYPGNIRELENILERACIFSEGNELTLTTMDSSSVKNENSDMVNEGTIKEMEKKMIERSLHKWEGNRTRTAQELGISRKTLLNKIKEFCLPGV